MKTGKMNRPPQAPGKFILLHPMISTAALYENDSDPHAHWPPYCPPWKVASVQNSTYVLLTFRPKVDNFACELFQFLFVLVSRPLLHNAVYLLGLWLSTHAAAFENPIFRRLTTERGLPQNSIFAITQDRHGYMWFGTQDGLSRYDGYTFKHFHNSERDSTTIPGNKINSLFEDSRGRLWVGTEDGLALFNPARENFHRFPLRAASTDPFMRQIVNAITEDQSHTIWVGTKQGPMRLFPGGTGFELCALDSLYPSAISDRSIYSLYAEGDSVIWIGGRIVIRYDVGSDHFSRVGLDSGSPAVEYEEFRSIIWDGARHEILLASLGGGGIYHLDAARRNLVQLLLGNELRNSPGRKSIYSMVRDSHGSLWIGSSGDGLTRASPDMRVTGSYLHNTFDEHSVGNNVILSLFIDRTDELWIGTFGGGVSRIPLRTNRFTLHRMVAGDDRGSLHFKSIRAIVKDVHGRVLVAGYGGIDIINRERTRVTPFGSTDGLKGVEYAYSMLEDVRQPGQIFWVGTDGSGLKRIDLEAKTVYPYPFTSVSNHPRALLGPLVQALLFDSSGNLWIGTSAGLNVLNPVTGQFKHFVHDPDDPQSLSPFAVTVLFRDTEGLMWVGTNGGGIDLFDEGTKKFRRFLPRHGEVDMLARRNIKCIRAGRDNLLWVGTDHGLFRISANRDSVGVLTTRDGLPNNVIYGIAEDSAGDLWMSTNHGVARLSPSTGSCQGYSPGDGLQGFEFNTNAHLQANDGEIFFGGINGLNSFHPANIVRSYASSPTIITKFRVFDRECAFDDNIATVRSIELSHEEDVISFEFSVLDYASPELNEFMCTMEGLDNAWNLLGNNNTITYANLKPGRYLFKVSGKNSDGVWSKEPATVAILIAPPFWGKTWFQILAWCVFLSIGPLIFYRRVSGLKKEKELKEDFSRRLIEHQEQERKRIAGELHDSLGQNLLVLKNQSVLGMKTVANAERTSELLARISELTSETLKEVRRISYNLHPYQLDRLGLTDALNSMFSKVQESWRVSFVSSIEPLEGLLSKPAEISLYRIVQEALNNVMKHSDAKHVAVTIRRDGPALKLRIEDDGKGFNIHAVAKKGAEGIGLDDMTERVSILKGTIKISSGPARGTRLEIEIPTVKNGRTHE